MQASGMCAKCLALLGPEGLLCRFCSGPPVRGWRRPLSWCGNRCDAKATAVAS